ncbi:LytTR family DNA-binding domain-containing protein [Fervidobacterium pennivorans subsp. shakshaketiis]|jgi:DNA-binding LytR/AlgR family response regulator|uniref:Response regulator of the LytR/AlgR family n=1 Tax=Fervidobacterium pennivorans (strain DSM 9078 / Ven5) TaxID=771875 RepID=H9UEI0_FERPD|nr:LytTR family DNA-binding domain-containing protein [Fervidobacterium pennivorans]AFG35923.1 response regulator of the LytR/AlgR family [Fervidobacterium pennivorans DSM 9078]QIV78988.1 response regulator transcription factor [Fervidobacterium pennivorans subsp. keratinolyticus]
MTCVIVEDEKLLAMVLEKMVKEEGLEVLGIAKDAEEAIRMIDEKKPEIVFLDINLGEHDGFYVLQHINHKPYVIFTTAYSEYAVKAFEENAVDYLLKPIKKERLHEAIEKVRKLSTFERANLYDNIQRVKDLAQRLKADKFIVEIGDEIVFLNVDEIIFLTSEKGETVVVTKNEKMKTKIPLKDCEIKLPYERFLRVHKSYIVNVEKIRKIIRNYFGSLALELSNGDIIPVGRNYKDSIKKLLE